MIARQTASEIILHRSLLWCNDNGIDKEFAFQSNTRLLARLHTVAKFNRIILLVLLSMLVTLRVKMNAGYALLQLPDKWLSANLTAIFLEFNGKSS